jgi:hypothetical protein
VIRLTRVNPRGFSALVPAICRSFPNCPCPAAQQGRHVLLETHVFVNSQWTVSNVEGFASGCYRSFAYSALASFRMGISGSASFHRPKKS